VSQIFNPGAGDFPMLQHLNHLQPATWLKFYLFLILSFGVWQLGVQPTQAGEIRTICKNNDCDFPTIQDAIAASGHDDILEFRASREIYSETIVIDKSLTLVGDATIINAQGEGTAVTITNNATVIMQNMTIQNGSEGGIQLINGDLTLLNVTLSNNDATDLGGALYVASGSSAQLNQVTIRQNTAVSGGAIYNDGTVVANNLTLSLNFATNGAGIYNSSNGTILLDTQTSIRQNGTTETLTTQTGGGIFNAGSLTLQNLDITNNKAQNGAGVYNVGSLEMNNSNLGNGNVAAQAGGGLHNSGQAALTNSAVVQNQADSGAGIYNAGTLTAINTTLSRNAGVGNVPSPNGPGLYHHSGTATLNNVTIHLTIGPSIFAHGGGISVGNTIISSVSGQSACAGTGAVNSNGYNLASDQSCAFLDQPSDVIGVNPDLNGITSPTQSAAYHTPKLGSPVVDAGNPAEPGSSSAACAASDQRGLARPQSRQCDIGAVEIVVYRLFLPVILE
jgi:hypothetical protein